MTRGRLIACDACRFRKLKCSRPLPEGSAPGLSSLKCLRCEQKNLACTYPKNRRWGGPKTGTRLQALRSSQQLLFAATNEDCSRGSDPGSVQPANSNVEIRPSCLGSTWAIPLLGDLQNLDVAPSTTYYKPSTGPGRERQNSAPPPASSSTAVRDQGPTTLSTEQEDSPAVDRDALGCSSPAILDFPFSKQGLMDQITLFFDESYQSYPIIHPDSTVQKAHQGLYLSDPEFRTLLLSLAMMNESRKFRGCPELGSGNLDFLSGMTETLRTGSSYHFSEPNSLDTVVVSLFLFVAYVARNKYTRAFTYLTEAIGLLDLIDCPADPIETIKYRRLEHLLFITESATMSIFGWRRRGLARQPLIPTEADQLAWPQDLDRYDIARLDSLAVGLLLSMTRVYIASDHVEVANVVVENLMADADTRNISTQTADLVITRLWKLACHWREAVVARRSLLLFHGDLGFNLRELGTTAICWSRAIPPYQLRNVGLRKIVALADELFHIATTLGQLTGHTDMLGSLVQLVADLDYERRFASELSAFDWCVKNVPQPIICDGGCGSGSVDADDQEACPQSWLSISPRCEVATAASPVQAGGCITPIVHGPEAVYLQI